MAKPTDTNPDLPATPYGNFSVPDKADLGWSPAEHVFVHFESSEIVGDVVAGGRVDEGESLAIEFDVADVPAESFLADIDLSDDLDVDLNGLFESVTPLDETSSMDMGTSSADDGTTTQPLPVTDSAQTSDFSSLFPLEAGLSFGEVTFVIDDDGPDTVAL